MQTISLMLSFQQSTAEELGINPLIGTLKPQSNGPKYDD